jgi:hypothetical protein
MGSLLSLSAGSWTLISWKETAAVVAALLGLLINHMLPAVLNS